MDIAGIRSAQDINPTPASGSSEELGKNQFLDLMIAQMNNQDPLDPAKNEDFIAQLAQFSTVEGIENMNNSMADMAIALQSSLTVQASSLVGRSVMVPTNQGVLGPQGLTGSVDVPETSANVQMEISGVNGELIRNIELGPRGAGSLRFGWDGQTDTGEYAAQGIYRIRAYSDTGTGRQELTVNLPDQVVSVSVGEAGVMANLAGGESIAAAQIKEIQ